MRTFAIYHLIRQGLTPHDSVFRVYNCDRKLHKVYNLLLMNLSVGIVGLPNVGKFTFARESGNFA